MRSAKLADVLTRLTIVLSIVAPFVVFGFLYALLVQPKRAEADAAERRLNTAREELDRPRTVRPHRDGNVLTFEGTRAEAAQFAQTLENLPAGTTLGSIEMTPSATADSLRVRAELRDARAPSPRSESLAPAKPEVPDVREAPPRPKKTEVPAPDPVVSSILVSSGRRVAIVDGQIVRAGDRLPAGVILDIEPDAIVIGGNGQRRRVELVRPGIANVR